jgi:anaerobic selenocysteine-containing dehydrogenase
MTIESDGVDSAGTGSSAGAGAGGEAGGADAGGRAGDAGGRAGDADVGGRAGDAGDGNVDVDADADGNVDVDADVDVAALGARVLASRAATEARGETFYPGPSKVGLGAFPPKERWDDWVELDSRSWPRRVERRSMLVPTTCFNCESACGLLAYVDRDTLQVRKFEGNPEHPGSRGRNCAKGPATINQVTDPDRILYPLRRVGARGEGRWERAGWDEALDVIGGRIRAALLEGRHNEIMVHIGRPGEDGFTERVLASWGVDGHNSHTNVCSSGGRTGFQFWTGIDRPSPDHAHADVIYLISSHLETGHYFNPHAQRITEARARGAKVIVLDTRLSNTATHADYWLSPQPGSEAAINLAIARHIVETKRYDREFIRRWWNWEEHLAACRPDLPQRFESFEQALGELYAGFTFDFAAAESGIDAATLAEVAEIVARAGTRFSCHSWRSAAAGNLGGWQVSRTAFLLAALLGAVATEGGTFPNAYNKFVPRPIHQPPHPQVWQELSWPLEFPLAQNELSFLLPHFLKDGRGRLDTYFTRVYNPVWTNPDGLSWLEVLADEDLVGCHVALTPTWNESAYFADWVLPVGLASERHDTHSYEQYDGQWIGFRQPVLRAARERLGEAVGDSRQANPGEVWEENELWTELSWRIDPDGSLGIRQYHESRAHPGQKLTVDEYYAWMFEHSVPGLPEAAAAQGLTPLQYMRRYGAFEITRGQGALFDQPVPPEELADVRVSTRGRVYSAAPAPTGTNIAPVGAPPPDGDGRRPVGVMVDGEVRRGFPTPSGRLEFYSSTLASWGWPEHAVPGYIRSHVHPANMAPDQMVLLSTFRLPTQIHTRSANAKWLDELAHANPVWIHPADAGRLGITATGDLVRVETDIGHFVGRAWITEGIRPGVVACSHHMGRWRIEGQGRGQGQAMATVTLRHDEQGWAMRRVSGVGPYPSDDPDTRRIWWTDVGVHQNLTFAVHPDPISGMHCWHQAVRVTPARPGDQFGDISVNTELARQVYRDWLERTRPAHAVSPDGTRRPSWLMRPLKPSAVAQRLPASAGS